MRDVCPFPGLKAFGGLVVGWAIAVSPGCGGAPTSDPVRENPALDQAKQKSMDFYKSHLTKKGRTKPGSP